MTNPFLKRVDLLTDWHNRFPDANVDLLAELILDAWQLAEEATEQRIIEEIYGNKEAFEYLVKPEFKELFVSSLVELIEGKA